MAESAFGPISPELVLVSPDLRAALLQGFERAGFESADHGRGRWSDVPAVREHPVAAPPASQHRPPEQTGPSVRLESAEPPRRSDQRPPAEPEWPPKPDRDPEPKRPLPVGHEPLAGESASGRSPEGGPPRVPQPDPPAREPLQRAPSPSGLVPATDPRPQLEPEAQPSLVVGAMAYLIHRVLVLGGQAAVVVTAVLVAIVALELLAHL